MIELLGITKKYKNQEMELTVLSDITLKIDDGEFVAIMGRSGAGKSTLLNILGCVDHSFEGKYMYDGVCVNDLNTFKRDEFRSNHISYVFQQFALLSDYSVFENIELPLRARNIPKKKINVIVEDAMKKLDITDLKNKRVTKLSGGQKQRVAIARAIVSGNNLILADEPTGALDSSNGQMIIDLLKNINREGKTVVVVTHDINIANQADRIIRIEDGSIIN